MDKEIEMFGGLDITNNIKSRTVKIKNEDYVVGEHVADYYTDRILRIIMNKKIYGGSELSVERLYPYFKKTGNIYKTTSYEIIKYIIDKSEIGDILIKKMDELKKYVNVIEDKYMSTLRTSMIGPRGETKFIKIQVFEINCGDIEYTKYNPHDLCQFINCVIEYLNTYEKMESFSGKTFNPIEPIKCKVEYPKNELIEVSDKSSEQILKEIEEPYVRLAKQIEQCQILVLEKIDSIIH